MQLIINNEPYTTDVPPFDRARWVRHGSGYNLELLEGGEVVLTFHDITAEDKDNYMINVDGAVMNIEDVPPSVEELRAALVATDYKIIKCSEYQLSGLSLPYDIAALHADRQRLRDQINELEG